VGVSLIDRDDEQLGKLIRHLRTGKRPATFTEGCPDDELLASYSGGLLDGLAKDQLESHLADCEICLDALTSACVATADPHLEPVPQRVIERAMGLIPDKQRSEGVFDLVVRLARDSLELVSTSMRVVPLATAGAIRGKRHPPKASSVKVEKELKRVSLFVEVEPLGGGLCQVSVTVKDGQESVAGAVRLNLISQGRQQASFLARRGSATFDRVTPGEYRLEVAQTRHPLVSMRLTITEGHDHG